MVHPRDIILIESQWNLNLSIHRSVTSVNNINRITVEFKFDEVEIPDSVPTILIESQWNLNDTAEELERLYPHINRITVEFKY